MPALTNANNATNIFLNQSWSDREVRTYESENPGTHGSQRAVGWPWLSFRMPPQSRSEHLDSRRGTGDEFVAFGGLVKRDPDRHTLSQPYPVEGRIDVGKQGRSGAAITILDTSRDAFHPTAQRMVAAHQPDVGGIAEMDARQLGLLEIALD